MNIPQIKILCVNWGLPADSQIMKEVGSLMIQILPVLYKVEYADDEGAVLHLLINQDQEEEIKLLRNTFIYIDVWFEGEEDPEKIKQERLKRWAKKKGVKA